MNSLLITQLARNEVDERVRSAERERLANLARRGRSARAGAGLLARLRRSWAAHLIGRREPSWAPSPGCPNEPCAESPAR